MNEVRYSIRDRITQLSELAEALAELLPILQSTPELAEHTERFGGYLERSRELLQFPGEDEIQEFGRSIDDIFYRHREWEPPMLKLPDGTREIVLWYAHVDRPLGRVMQAAERLTQLGYY
jgi:hypothetical protein